MRRIQNFNDGWIFSKEPLTFKDYEFGKAAARFPTVIQPGAADVGDVAGSLRGQHKRFRERTFAGGNTFDQSFRFPVHRISIKSTVL